MRRRRRRRRYKIILLIICRQRIEEILVYFSRVMEMKKILK